MKKIIIIGGGVSGLITAIRLARAEIPCLLIEKKHYPFHRVCGEYVSNETVPFLKSLNLFPEAYSPPAIDRFQLSSVTGKSQMLPLDLGGFGISRYSFDYFLYEQARLAGVTFFLKEEVDKIHFQDNQFTVQTQRRMLDADIVIGAFGKRSKLDIQLHRSFIKKRSPYVGVKYHIKTTHPDDLIALHNFRGGYCGISNVEDKKSNLCYLAARDVLKRFGSIREMEEKVLFKNPFLKEIFLNAQFLFEKPETINEISFATKFPVENHILMTGDAAGMITPLCGNGMAMGIHAAKIVSDLVIRHVKGNKFSRDRLEQEYIQSWNAHFKRRLWFGRQVQNLFGNEVASNAAVGMALMIRPVAKMIMRNTHGSPF